MKHTTYNVILKEAGVRDRFGRVYPLEELQKLCDHINENPVFGKIGPSTQRELETRQLDVEMVSHSITNPIIKDNKLMVTLKVLPTPEGERLLDILNHHEEVSVSGGLLDRERVIMDGIGKVDDSGIIKEFSLLSINVKTDLES